MRAWSTRRPDAELEPAIVNVTSDVRDAVRVTERVGEHGAVGTATGGPAVVDVDVVVTGCGHAALNHRVGHRHDFGFAVGRIALEMIPAVPSHGRPLGEAPVGSGPLQSSLATAASGTVITLASGTVSSTGAGKIAVSVRGPQPASTVSTATWSPWQRVTRWTPS